MRDDIVRGTGLALAVIYAGFIGWLYVRQPQTAAEVTGGISSGIGAYRIDAQAFDEGLQLFRRGEFAARGSALARADPARQDAPTQFYIAYSYYVRLGGRFYQDDALFAQALEVLARHRGRAGRSDRGDDPDCQMHTGDELQRSRSGHAPGQL